MKVSDLMIRDLVTIGPKELLREAFRKMNAQHIRHLPVVDEGRLVGMITDRDVRLHATSFAEIRGEEKLYTISADADVRDIMTRDPIVTFPDTDLREVIDLFLEEKVGAIPVVTDANELVGIIGYTDLLALLSTELKE